MSKTATMKPQKKLSLLEAKKECLFQKVQVMYEVAKNINIKEQEGSFKMRIRSLGTTVANFNDVVEEIASAQLDLDPNAEV